MVVKLNPYSELAQLFDLGPYGYVATAMDVVQRIQESTHEIDFQSDEPMVRESLAPSFGSFDNAEQSVKDLDDKMKFMVASTLKELLKLKRQGTLAWSNILWSFYMNPYVVAMEGAQEIAEQFVSESSADFKFDGSPDPSLVQKVMNWWNGEACPDPDIRNDAQLDVKSLAKIVAWSGATVTNFWDVWSKHEHHERQVLEVGVMRFPSVGNPHFKLYRIQLHAWSDCTRTVWHQEDKNGIRSVVTSQRFRPNDEMLRQIGEETTKKAAGDIDGIFGDEGEIARGINKEIDDMFDDEGTTRDINKEIDNMFDD